MSKLRVLSGAAVIKILANFGFKVVGQKGSHVKLRRIIKFSIKQTLTISNHRELDRGTIKAIYNQSLRYISGEELRKYFYY